MDCETTTLAHSKHAARSQSGRCQTGSSRETRGPSPGPPAGSRVASRSSRSSRRASHHVRPPGLPWPCSPGACRRGSHPQGPGRCARRH
eukprot:10920349-Alexandrium_andersonii.AAC.1